MVKDPYYHQLADRNFDLPGQLPPLRFYPIQAISTRLRLQLQRRLRSAVPGGRSDNLQLCFSPPVKGLRDMLLQGQKFIRRYQLSI